MARRSSAPARAFAMRQARSWKPATSPDGRRCFGRTSNSSSEPPTRREDGAWQRRSRSSLGAGKGSPLAEPGKNLPRRKSTTPGAYALAAPHRDQRGTFANEAFTAVNEASEETLMPVRRDRTARNLQGRPDVQTSEHWPLMRFVMTSGLHSIQANGLLAGTTVSCDGTPASVSPAPPGMLSIVNPPCRPGSDPATKVASFVQTSEHLSLRVSQGTFCFLWSPTERRAGGSADGEFSEEKGVEK